MKRGIPIIWTVLGLLLSLGLLRLWLPASTTGGPLPALQGEAAFNYLKEQGLYGSLQEAVTAARYGFYQEPKRRGDWLAYNPAQRLSARLTPDGLQVVTGGDEGRSHRLGMKLRCAGYGARQMAAKAGRLTAGGARAEIHYELPQSAIPESQSAIIEWYHNTEAGLEQGFTIESAPGERRDGERLRMALALEGELRAEVVEGGQALEFRDDAGRRALRYDHLVVRDGAGRELEARMAATEEEGEVWLEVDDRDAVWPVTIDPTFTQQQKLLASGAAEGDVFGGSVAISGETVVVGAERGDGAAGSDQGLAYVFVRSGAVWSEQQKLEASDAVAFDNFGFSVGISGGTVVVGAIFDDGAAGTNHGSAYVFLSAPINTPPAITAASVSRTQGLPASIGAIAQVNDAEDALNTLNVTVNGAASATVNGVTVSSISLDASGQVTASVGADCNASDASFALRVTDSGGLFAEAILNVTVTPEMIPPVIACPVNVVMTLPPNTMDTQMVVNYPAPSATDNCTASPSITTSQDSGTIFPVGITTVNVSATDAANNQATCSFTVTVRYNFSGFFQPVDNPPTVNVVNAGRAIPVKFSLSGNKGLNIFAAGFPVSQHISCSDSAPLSEIEQTVTAGGSSLSYDAESDAYTYVWKTEQLWAGTCRQLIVRLNDGSERVAFFKFK